MSYLLQRGQEDRRIMFPGSQPVSLARSNLHMLRDPRSSYLVRCPASRPPMACCTAQYGVAELLWNFWELARLVNLPRGKHAPFTIVNVVNAPMECCCTKAPSSASVLPEHAAAEDSSTDAGLLLPSGVTWKAEGMRYMLLLCKGTTAHCSECLAVCPTFQ